MVSFLQGKLLALGAGCRGCVSSVPREAAVLQRSWTVVREELFSCLPLDLSVEAGGM